MKNVWISASLAAACCAAVAKLPPVVLDDAGKLKAAETAAKTGWQGKTDAYLLCKVQDRVAAVYRKSAGSAGGRDAKPVTVSTSATATVAAAPAAPAPAAVAPPAAAAAPAKPAASAALMVAANPAVPGGTAAAPAGAPTPVGCADPGPFAFNAPAEKPLETAGAHSPAGNATSPPSVKSSSAEMAPAKPAIKK